MVPWTAQRSRKKQNIKINIRGYLTLIYTQTKTWRFRNQRLVFCKGISAMFGPQISETVKDKSTWPDTSAGVCVFTLNQRHTYSLETAWGKRALLEVLEGNDSACSQWMSYFRAGLKSMRAWGWREQSRLAQYRSPNRCRVNQTWTHTLSNSHCYILYVIMMQKNKIFALYGHGLCVSQWLLLFGKK